MRDTIKLEPRREKIASSECVKCVGFIFQSSGDIQQDVTHRIKCDWLKCRATIGLLCDRDVSLNLKSKFYRTTLDQPPTLFYGSEC